MTRLSSLLWLIGIVTFFLSAALDNLTTTIVMISLMRRLLDRQGDRLFSPESSLSPPMPAGPGRLLAT